MGIAWGGKKNQSQVAVEHMVRQISTCTQNWAHLVEWRDYILANWDLHSYRSKQYT